MNTQKYKDSEVVFQIPVPKVQQKATESARTAAVIDLDSPGCYETYP